MDEETLNLKVDHIGHLGLVRAIVDQYKLVEIINDLLPKKSNSSTISHGDVILSMIYLGLGITDNRIYQAEQFFTHLPLDKLFGKNFSPELFKKDAFARTLDAIYEYGSGNFFCDIAFRILSEHDLISKYFRMDSTSFSQGKRKNMECGELKITHGHSKDHRVDLPQIVQMLVTTNGALPFWSKSHSGNAADKEIFEQTILEVQNYFNKLKISDSFTYIADSALYTKGFLLNKEIKCNWITRIPKSIKKVKNLVERNYDDCLWTKIDKDYKFIEIEEYYAGVKQRWILVRNRKAKYKQLATFKNKIKKEEELIYKRLTQIGKKVYFTKDEIQRKIKSLKEKHPCFAFKNIIVGAYKSQRGIKRRIRIGYRVKITGYRNETNITKIKNQKGRFIIGTNLLDDEQYSAKDILLKYRGQTGEIESCFKFMKDSKYKLNTIYQTRPERVVSMMQVISLILFVNNLGEKKLRDNLAKENIKIPNQIGKMVSNPTLRWVFQLFRKVTRIRINIENQIHEKYDGLLDPQKRILEAFGNHAKAIYGFT